MAAQQEGQKGAWRGKEGQGRGRRMWLGNVYVLVRELHNRGRSDKVDVRKPRRKEGNGREKKRKKERKKVLEW